MTTRRRKPAQAVLEGKDPSKPSHVVEYSLFCHLGKIRRALERIAEAQELRAILELQASVPSEHGAKLDAWRDQTLARMVQRHRRRRMRDVV